MTDSNKTAEVLTAEFLSEDDLSPPSGSPRTQRRSSRRGRRRNSSSICSGSLLSPTSDPFVSTASLVAVGRSCPDLSACDKDGSEEDAALTAWARTPKAWQQRAAPPKPPPQRVCTPDAKAAVAPVVSVVPCFELEANPHETANASQEILSPLSDVMSERVWRDLSLAVMAPWRTSEEDGSGSLHRSARGGEFSPRSPLRDRDRAACVFAPGGSMSGSLPMVGGMSNFSFDCVRKRGSDRHSSADNSVQGASTARERVNCELPRILVAGSSSSSSRGTPLRPLRGDESPGERQSGSILLSSECSNRDSVSADRVARREKCVSFTGELYI
ncbi:hypothetical protein STCU_09921 [Strigomonas culicis]|uniref:Uncharacterized protein n=1 Tax=Strigomonas culicis TaxID=28005 RepID=S9UV75_9TRYP|nr:hypothetical protein STCU_09921 [Strigomonas culicis]|eukprot:EPY18421.1 hypothetical protein STCU_09921 [Strigomonas culicis]